MNLAIVGYGKMGRMVEQFAPEFGFSIHSKIDAGDSLANAKGADVAIEFSTPEAAISNIEGLTALGVPTVTGTTGWLPEIERVRAAIAKNDGALIWSANFSIGVNVLLRAVQEVSRLLANEPAYEAWAWEIHHSAKKDAPSGTLRHTARTREGFARGALRAAQMIHGRKGVFEFKDLFGART
jgi:4-hydroxy-tetrahydrodipicolinate reductase